MSRDVLTVSSTMRIPWLYRGEYSQWSERFMNYLEEQTDGEAMINSIKNGDQPLPRVTQVSIPGTLSTEQPPLKDKSMCNKTAKDLWDALARHMLGFKYGEQDRKTVVLYEYETFKYIKKTILVTYDPLALIAEKTKVSKRKEKVVISLDFEGSDADDKQEFVKSDEKKEDKKVKEKKRDMSKVKCYNCKKEGHFAKDCKKAKVKDYEYYKTKMLLAKKDKDEQVLLAEDHAWMESSSDLDQEINANMVFMAQIEKVLSDSEAGSSSSDDKIAEVFDGVIHLPYLDIFIIHRGLPAKRSLSRFAGQQTYTMSDLGCCGLEHHSWENVGNLLHSYQSSFSVMSLGKPVMSSASSAVTYTSVYTNSEPGRVFWGADEELSDGGSLRVIVYGYDGLPMRPVAPPSPDYIPGPEEPQTPPVPEDEDEREPMFIQPHDPDYVPEPMYPEYIPLEDEHVLSVEEQSLPPIDSPTVEPSGYVAESDPKEDLDEDDETEDGPEEEEEEHFALADSAIVILAVEPVSLPEITEPIIPPPSTDTTTTRARITIRLQATISLTPEAEVERLLAMPTPPPSPLASLSPPSARERLARWTAPSACPSPPPIPLLPSSACPTQIQALRLASTRALIDAVAAALPSPPLPPPVDRRDDIPKIEMPPRKRLLFSTLGSRYEVKESSTARPTGGRGIDYRFVSTLDAEARRQGIGEVGYGIRDTLVDPAEAVPEIAPMTVREVNTRVTELAELHEHDAHDLYALLEDTHDRLSQAVHYELQTHREQVYAHEFQLQAHQTQLQLQGTLIQTQHQLHETRFQMQQAEIKELRETNRRRQAQMIETLRVMGDMRREMGNMQAELLALREQPRRARKPGEDSRVPNHQDTPRDADSHI
nr:hypothetical protein [Tanacetum cinerariifolium]